MQTPGDRVGRAAQRRQVVAFQQLQAFGRSQTLAGHALLQQIVEGRLQDAKSWVSKLSSWLHDLPLRPNTIYRFASARYAARI